MYQVYFTELTTQSFTQEQRDFYRPLVSNQTFPIGNEVCGRRLLRCLTSDFATIETFLNSLGKEVYVCGAKDINNNLVEGFNYDPIEFEKYFVPDAEGNILPDNTSAGWTSFREQ